MESEKIKQMFENDFFLTNESSIEIIETLLNNKLPYFRKTMGKNSGMFFGLEYQYKDYTIYFGGDRGDLIYSLKIKEQAIDLKKYDLYIKYAVTLSEKNIKYVIKVILDYLLKMKIKLV